MRKLSIRERVLLLLLAVIAVVSAYVLLFSMPMSRRLEELNARIAQSEELTTQLEVRLTQQRQMEQAVEQMAAREDALPVMPEYDNLQMVMVELNSILAGCQSYSISFRGEQAEGNVFCRQAIMPFTCGSYAQARDVLERLQNGPLRGVLEEVQLSQQEDGTVSASATMSFFEYRSSPTEETNGG